MKKLFIILICAGIMPLQACSKTKEQFDFSKKAPDEFAITTRAPLEMPPSFNDLPQPHPGKQRPQEESALDMAKQAVFGEDTKSQPNATISQGETILLQKTGAAEADPNIRNKIDEETQELVKENTPTIDRILGKVGKDVDVPAEVVNPVKESERIMSNKEKGVPITEGETPTVER